MKKLLFFACIFFYLFFTITCKKSKKDKKPEIKMVSATVNMDGTVLVTAEILSEGAESIENMGFCMDTLPRPFSLNNQQIVNDPQESQFSTAYTQKFNSDKTYYFWSWIKNSNGYTYSDKISLSNIKAIPIEEPCSLKLNSFNTATVNTVTRVEQTLSQSNLPVWNIIATTTPSFNIQISFSSEPRTKMYHAATGFPRDPLNNFVVVTISSEIYYGQLWDAEVYVNEKSQGIYDITICEGLWHAYKSSHYAFSTQCKARFISPLN